ncbi:MAG: family 78 glycoside hydrolase catalytic domain [Lachnospiraceae bacterium]|nr:family 78 glycoside hydrolase catalytic domain [Lachnospiraceae bacterium]
MYLVYGEKCCGQKKPSALVSNPIFSWRLKSDRENEKQTGYEIHVKTMDGKTIWTSGKVISEKVHGIPYEGPQLESAKDYLWIVTSSSEAGECAVSKPQFFSTGILEQDLWKAKWIEPDLKRKVCEDETEAWKLFAGMMPYLENPEEKLNPCTYFRKVIEVDKKIKNVKAFATAHGIYELYINGTAYGNPLAPGYTVYKEYQEYQGYDVTDSFKEGKNVLGAVVADGWYLGKVGLMGVGNQYGENPAFFMQLVINYEDGTMEMVGTDADFVAGAGAYLYADLFVGEGYDARKENDCWTNCEYQNRNWKPVVIKDYGYHPLRGSADETAAFVRIEKAKEILRSPKGELIVNAGENISGVLGVKGNASAGTVIKLEYCEVLDKEGNYLQNILGQNKNQTDVYITGKDGAFYYRPKFTFHGFQYVRISGIEDLKLEDIQIYVLASDMERTGEFICSNAKLNQLQENIFRSQQGNMLYVPTDCPQREKAGWTGDMQAYAPTAAYLMDVEAFLGKWLENMRLEQQEDGQVPHVIPDIPSNRYIDHSKEICSSGWADACVIVPYRLFMAYGNKEILKENYAMMLKWMKYVEEKAASEIPQGLHDLTEEQKEYQKYLWNTGFHYGDWLIPSLSRTGVADPMKGAEMTKELVAPAMYAYTSGLMVEICETLGEKAEAERFRGINQKIKEAYTHEYLMADGHLKLDYQGIYVLALQMDLVPDDKKEFLLNHLIELIKENDGCLDTGFLSMPFLLDVLYENGRQEEAYKLLYQEKCPSWLYEINKGANTIWESWTNISEDDVRSSSSYNHFAFGSVGDFIYRRMLGLQCVEPGYRRVKIKPDINCGLNWAKGTFESVYGLISVAWSLVDQKKMILDVEIPPNTTAEIVLGDHVVNKGSGKYHLEKIFE